MKGEERQSLSNLLHLGYLNNLCKIHIKESCLSVHVYYRTAFSDHWQTYTYTFLLIFISVYFLYNVISNNPRRCWRYCLLNVIWIGQEHYVFFVIIWRVLNVFQNNSRFITHKNQNIIFYLKGNKSVELKDKSPLGFEHPLIWEVLSTVLGLSQWATIAHVSWCG